MRHETADAANSRGSLQQYAADRCFGKCRQSHQCWCDFSSAAALHMDAVLLTPGCSNPLYRRAMRVSMGTVFQVPWTIFPEKEKWPEDGMAKLQQLGFKTAAMALRNDTVNIDDPGLMSEERLAIVLGTEGDGLCEDTIANCDYTVKIPMAHGVDSLNVAAASAVAFWQLGNR